MRATSWKAAKGEKGVVEGWEDNVVRIREMERSLVAIMGGMMESWRWR